MEKQTDHQHLSVTSKRERGCDVKAPRESEWSRVRECSKWPSVTTGCWSAGQQVVSPSNVHSSTQESSAPVWWQAQVRSLKSDIPAGGGGF